MKIHWTYFLSNSITFKIYRKCSWDLYISMETHKKAPRRWKKQQHRMSVCVCVFLVKLTNKQKAQPSWMTSNANSHHWRVELLHLIYQFFIRHYNCSCSVIQFIVWPFGVFFFHIISRKFCRKMANSVNSGVNQLIVHK